MTCVVSAICCNFRDSPQLEQFLTNSTVPRTVEGSPWKGVAAPCCVFSDLFPARRTAAGAPVTSFEDFAQYLQAKDHRIQRAYLPFVGKNLALFLNCSPSTA